MTMESHGFKRLVIGLQRSPSGRMLRFAVEFAELLQVELLGLFLADTSLRDLARMPFARELRPLNGGWHALDFQGLSRDIERNVRDAEHTLAEAARSLADRYRFEVIRGPLATALGSVSRRSDIVIVAEPLTTAERMSQQFTWLIEAAFRSAAAVMIVPSRIARATGPIAAIVAGRDDPSLDAAAALARAAKEDLVFVDIGNVPIEDAEIRARSAAVGRPARHVVLDRGALSDPGALDRRIPQLEERLLVLTRGVVDDQEASAIASVRGVPLLVVEPAATTRQIESRQSQ